MVGERAHSKLPGHGQALVAGSAACREAVQVGNRRRAAAHSAHQIGGACTMVCEGVCGMISRLEVHGGL